jgi:hypothetical protein
VVDVLTRARQPAAQAPGGTVIAHLLTGGV